MPTLTQSMAAVIVESTIWLWPNKVKNDSLAYVTFSTAHQSMFCGSCIKLVASSSCYAVIISLWSSWFQIVLGLSLGCCFIIYVRLLLSQKSIAAIKHKLATSYHLPVQFHLLIMHELITAALHSLAATLQLDRKKNDKLSHKCNIYKHNLSS